MPRVELDALLQSGAHFGHLTRRWNPKMKPYIFAERGGIHIIDLQQTTIMLDRAYDFVRNVTSRGVQDTRAGGSWTGRGVFLTP